jgi:predicted ATPase/DNA-binding winged helix-turn-helix (wHTH) protein
VIKQPSFDRGIEAAERAAVFGAFRLRPAQQLLLEEDRPLRIGGRALDILVTLVEQAGELVSKDELVARVWPNTIVDEANLRTQIGLLRRVLGDGRAGARYVVTVPGRGYRFVAPVAFETEGGRDVAPNVSFEHLNNLPIRLNRLIGRADDVAAIGSRLQRRRLVTIVGPGGIGKTTVALATAEGLPDAYRDGVFFIDLAPLSDPLLIPSLLASVLGVTSVSEDLFSGLVAALQRKRLLLLLDSCEHLVEPVAVIAEKLLKAAPNLHILATSREALRVEGEAVYRLPPLETPPASAELTAAEVAAFPAVQLFIDRAASGDGTFELSDADAPIVGEICRKLDGMALAIELAAGRVDTFGVREMAAHLDDRFRLLLSGRRTALPRHRTLEAALDWSYQSLSEPQRAVLRRLSAFAGTFTLEAAQSVAADAAIQAADVVDHIADLVAKSLLTADVGSDLVRYRLLDTTRVYAQGKLDLSGEGAGTAGRHAEYYRRLLQQAGVDAERRPLQEWLDAYGRELDNVRKALDWSFSTDGDETLGFSLTAAALPLWMQFSLMSECRTRVETALSSALPAERRNARLEMQLFHALGAVLLNIETSGPAIVSALTKALEIAIALDETDYRLRAIWCLWCHALNRGAFREALALADEFRAVAVKSADPVDPLTGQRMRGFVLHFLGDQEQARRDTEYMIDRYVAPPHRAHIIRFQFDQLITARNTLGQVLWLQGFVDQARVLIEHNIADALSLDHALSLCNALTKGACPVSLMAGDLPAADHYIRMLLDRSARHGFAMWHGWGNCFKAILLIKQGTVRKGLNLLASTLRSLSENRFSLRYTWVLSEQADGLRQAGEVADGLRTIDEAIERSERDDERWCISDLLRVKADLVLAQGAPGSEHAAEDLLRQSLGWARRQSVLSWELRSAMSFARLLHEQGRSVDAREVLAPVYGRFTEGFATQDLLAASSILNRLD